MRELDFINRWLGGHRVTLEGVARLAGEKRQLSICEIGCGGGDNLKAIHHWAARKKIQIKLTGIDIKQACINYAGENCRQMPDTNWICSDYRDVVPEIPFDIVFSSLFCHHFPDEGVQDILKWMNRQSRLGFFINDLHRHPLAYHFIRIQSAIFSRSYLVKHDAPLSVLRGFRKNEWIRLAGEALPTGWQQRLSLSWKWAFRWLLSYEKTETAET